MKKTLVFGAATAAVALTLGSCAITSCQSETVETLYGPPAQDNPQSNTDVDEPIEDVYGSPVDVEDPSLTDETGDDSEEMVFALYGPPSVLDDDQLLVQDDEG